MLQIIYIILITIATTQQQQHCQLITIPMCKSIGYNETQLPNAFNHESQEEAGLEVHQYWPLVEIKCSTDLRFFICSLYVPICMEDYVGTVPPCASVCQRARSGCEPVMVQYGFPWPDRMNCAQFPTYGKGNICMDEKSGQLPTTSTTAVAITTDNDCNCVCKTDPTKNETCPFPCHLYDKEEEREFIRNWLGFWSAMCILSTSLLVLTCFVDRKRFKWPEKAVVWLCACFMGGGIGVGVGVMGGEWGTVGCVGDVVKMGAGLDDWNCIVVFLLVYGFHTASCMWWLILTTTWYLTTTHKWSTESLENYTIYYHAFVWIVSIGLSGFVINAGLVQGDGISGLCSVNGLWWRIGVNVVTLVVGAVLMGSGFVSAVRVRAVLILQQQQQTTRGQQQQHQKTLKLEKLMIRMSIFTLFYIVPNILTILITVYEVRVMEAKEELVCGGKACSGKVTEGAVTSTTPDKPAFIVIMLKYFIQLSIGLTCGLFWIWSSKTLGAWSRFCCGLGKMVERGDDAVKEQQRLQVAAVAASCRPSHV